MAVAFSPLPALDPATAPIDGKSSRERLAFAAQFARLVRFYNLENRIEGDWQPFLLKDAAILLASIAATDYQGLHAQYEALTQKTTLPPIAQQAMLPALLRLLQHMFATLAHWFHWLDWQDESFPLRAFLARAVREQLALDLARTRDLHQALAQRQLTDIPDMAWYRSLGPAWQIMKRTTPDELPTADKDDTQAVALALTELRQRYLDTLNVMVQTVDAAANHYDLVARQPTPHPDTALLRVFVELMQYQQETMNRIGHRHLDFYYKRVLHIDARKATPDHVVVLLAPAADQASVTLPPGTRFSAGKDANGTPLWYANPDSAVINTTRIAAAFSLKAQASAENDHGFAPGIHATRLANLEDLQKDTSGHLLDQAIFGTPTAQVGLGFAIASPMLLLEGGNRNIVLTCELATPNTPLPDAWAQDWQCWLSSSKGWFDASAYALPPHVELAGGGQPSKLLLELMLPPDALPVLPADKPLDGRTCPWPQLKFALPPTTSAHPWPKINALRLEVKVRELTNLQLWNDLGPLTATAPTLPLGPIPQTGSRFFVGSREIFAKPISKLVLTLQWANLPANLADWYNEYNQWQSAQHPDWPAFDNTVHGGSWQWLQSDGWQTPTLNVPNGKLVEALFQGNNKSVFTFRFGTTQRPSPQLALNALPSPQDARAGYLAFTLQNPPQAFGHRQYPQVLVWSSQQQAERLMKPTPSDQSNAPGIPNPPFTPTLQTAFAEYSASFSLVPGADTGDADPFCPCQWFHYGPWHNWLAWQTGAIPANQAPLAPGASTSGLCLVPRVADTGTLLLALDALQSPCSLRLFACVTNDGEANGFDAWFYGTGGWQPVEVWQDDSHGLSGSGLIELSLQSRPASLPLTPDLTNCAWLALTPHGSWRALRLALLATQAIRLERQDLPTDCEQVPPLAPNTIKKPPLPQLATVRQPLASQNGRGAENYNGYVGINNYYARVSQRLLHKGRALTPRDFVLLAHEAMPELYRIELLPSHPAARGEIKLGVVPRIANPTEAGAFRPRLPPSERAQLAAHLQACSSGATHVSVLNLMAREVTLAANLILTPDAQAAWPSLRHEWNHSLRLYLSPWIITHLPQYDLKHGLGRADLLRRLAGFPGVLAIEALTISVADNTGKTAPYQDNLLVPPPGVLWVSTQQHLLTLAKD